MHYIFIRDWKSHSVMNFQSLIHMQYGCSMLTISASKQCSNTLPAALGNIVIHPPFLLPYNSSCIFHIVHGHKSRSMYHLGLHSNEKLQTFLMQYLQCIVVQQLPSSWLGDHQNILFSLLSHSRIFLPVIPLLDSCLSISYNFPQNIPDDWRYKISAGSWVS